jgi:GAF domain-containing protein
MQERAAAQDGFCSISAAGDRGTVVHATMPIIVPRPTSAMVESQIVHENELTALRYRFNSISAAAGDARREALQVRRLLRGGMALLEALNNPAASSEAIIDSSVRLLGDALHGGCAIHLLSADEKQLVRSASWHQNPGQLARLNESMFGDLDASTGHARTVLNGGQPVLADISGAEPARRSEPELRDQPHTMIFAPLAAEGQTLGTVMVARDQTPERFTNDDIDFVKAASAQIGIAVLRRT